MGSGNGPEPCPAFLTCKPLDRSRDGLSRVIPGAPLLALAELLESYGCITSVLCSCGFFHSTFSQSDERRYVLSYN